MRHAQIIACGLEGRLADLMREIAQTKEAWLREVRQSKTALNLLRKGAGLLVLSLGKNLDQELSALERVSLFFPAAKSIVVGPVENHSLAALVWDLGAAYVLFPPQPIEQLRPVVLGFLNNNL
jgi:hypothetical protein